MESKKNCVYDKPQTNVSLFQLMSEEKHVTFQNFLVIKFVYETSCLPLQLRKEENWVVRAYSL